MSGSPRRGGKRYVIADSQIRWYLMVAKNSVNERRFIDGNDANP